MARIVMPSESRKLSRGYGWQQYVAMTVRFVNETDFSTNWKSFAEMEAARAIWIDKISAFIYNRSKKLGLIVDKVTQQLIEEPNESKLLEVTMWEGANIKFVWSLWCDVRGPVPENLIKPNALPLVGFWPREVNYRGNVPEILDAEQLSALEQHSWDNRKIQVGSLGR